MTHLPSKQIERHKAAIKRSDYSRPVKCLWRDRIITPDRTLFDYGCGHGDDLSALREEGINCEGFDPSFRPDVTPQQADIVNIGYPRDPNSSESVRRLAETCTSTVNMNPCAYRKLHPRLYCRTLAV